MAETFSTTFAGSPPIANGPDHHIFVAEIVDGVGADPTLRNLFTQLGSNIDPQTGRAYFDIGNRADNSLTVLSPRSPDWQNDET